MSIQQKLAERIYELLPHKKELEFGCEWKLNDDIWTYANGFSFIKNNKNSWSSMLPEDIEIIGQPIRLADVLMCLEEKKYPDILLRFEKDNLRDKEMLTVMQSYNLSKDNILDQSDEFCEFVLDLIK